MSGFNGSGVWVAPTPVVSGTVIQSSVYNANNADIAAGFNNTLTRDGQGVMSGVFKITDGTASLPGIAFNTESGSGMFRPSAGIVGFTAGGIENFRINSNGRMLIGATADDGTNKIQLTGATAVSGTLIIRTSSADGSGLVISTGSSGGKIKFTASDSTERASISAFDSGGAGPGIMTFSTNNASAVPTERARITQAGYLGVGTTNPQYTVHTAANLANAVFGATSTDAGGATAYLQANSSVDCRVGTVSNVPMLIMQNSSERMRVDTSGNVGIGMIPTYRLDVAGTIRTVGTEGVYGVRLVNSAGTSGFSVNIGGAGNAAGGYLSADGGPMWIVAGGQERLRIDTGGNLGVGQTPWAWGGGLRGIDIVGGSSVASSTSALFISSNMYYNGALWTRSNTNAPCLYTQQSGTHNWYANAGGTAGATFTPTVIMSTTGANGLSVTGAVAAGGGLSGTTGVFSSIVTASQVIAAGSGTGSIQLNPGSTSAFTGHIAFVAANNNRQCYIGNSTSTGTTDTGTLNYVANQHSFTGSIVASGNITAFSDASLKKDIAPITDALSKIEQTVGVTYNRIDTGEAGIGFIAQELQTVLPELVHQVEGGLLSVAYGNITAVLVEAVKELLARIKVLEAK